MSLEKKTLKQLKCDNCKKEGLIESAGLVGKSKRLECPACGANYPPSQVVMYYVQNGWMSFNGLNKLWDFFKELIIV